MEEMTDWLKQVVKSVDINQIDVSNVCGLIETKQLSIERVVTDLCSFLTNTDFKERSKGVLILSTILYHLPNDSLSSKEVQHLAQFYCDRLKDHYTVVPNVFTGLLAITNSKSFDSNLSPIIFNGLVKELSLQQNSVSERFLVFKLLTTLFERSAEQFKSIRSDFIYGLIQLIEGERDPRCLLLVFKLVHSVASSLELEPFTEDLFEVISCYFPVLFTPPPNDEYGITKEDLSESLNLCLGCSSDFSQFLFPLVFEKLESELIAAKVDSYKLIEIVCPKYGFEKIRDHINQLWTAIRIDTLKPKVLSNEVTECALKALSSISVTIASNRVDFDSFIELIWKDISNAFNRPELDLMESAVEILLSTISTDSYAYKRFGEKLIPLLLKQFTFTQKESLRISIIESLSKMLSSIRILPEKSTDFTNSESIFTLLISVAISGTESEDLRESVIQCLEQLIASIKTNANHWNEISRVLHNLFDNDFCNQKLMSKVYSLIESLTIFNPEFVSSLSKNFIDNFKLEYETEVNRNRLICILGAFPYLSKDYNSFELIAIHLIKQIKYNSYLTDKNQEISLHLMESLSKCISCETSSNNEEDVKPFVFNNFLDPMIQHCVHLSICTDNKSGTHLNLGLLNGLFTLIGKTVSKVSLQKGQHLFDKLYKFSTFGAVDQLLPSVPPTCFCTFQTGPQFLYTLNGTQALIVFRLISELISNLKYKLISKDSIELFDKLLDFATNDRFNNREVSYLASKSIGALSNRFDDKNDIFNEKLKQILVLFNERLYNSEESDEKQLLIIDVLVWMTKGLVISKHRMRKEFIDLLISLCEHNNQFIRNEVSKAFEIIHRTEDNCLTEDNNAMVAILYNQRFYFETFDDLLKGYLRHKNANSETKQTFLTALLTQLNYIPNAVFSIELKRLVPMLLEAISSDASQTNQRVALEAISQMLIDKSGQILSPSLKTCTFNCIDLSINSPFLKVRRSALNCLAQIADSFEESEILYLRDQLVKELRKSLSDKKRVVRRSAVRARCKWILVGQPGK